VAEDQQTERWTMPIETCAICDKDRDPFDVPDEPCGHHYDNRRTVMVEVVPAQTAERLATAAEQILTTPRNERRLSHWTELQDAISAFRAGSSKEGQ
jgi:hypothetical protein